MIRFSTACDGATCASTYATGGEFGAGGRVTKGPKALADDVQAARPFVYSRYLAITAQA
jgi:hypothetical protein